MTEDERKIARLRSALFFIEKALISSLDEQSGMSGTERARLATLARSVAYDLPSTNVDEFDQANFASAPA